MIESTPIQCLHSTKNFEPIASPYKEERAKLSENVTRLLSIVSFSWAQKRETNAGNETIRGETIGGWGYLALSADDRKQGISIPVLSRNPADVGVHNL